MSARVKTKTGDIKLSAEYLVGCDGGASVVRKQLGIKLAGRSNLMQLRQALYRCDELFERIPIGKGRHYHVAEAQAIPSSSCRTRRGISRCTRWSRATPRWPQFERTVAMPVKYEMLSSAVAAESAARRPLRRRPRVPRRRRGASRDSDRRPRHEQRRRRRDRPGWKLAATLQGWGGPTCSRPTRSSAGRSASAMSPRRAMPRSGGASGARPTSRTSATTRRKVPRPAPSWQRSPRSSSARATR